VRNISNEEKLVRITADYISDLRLDLDLVGKYFAWYLPNVSFRRLTTIIEAAVEERNNDRNHIQE
jgi:hypothetical protein